MSLFCDERFSILEAKIRVLEQKMCSSRDAHDFKGFDATFNKTSDLNEVHRIFFCPRCGESKDVIIQAGPLKSE